MNSPNSQPHDWKEWRRIRALALARKGWLQRDIAIALDVSDGAVSRWLSGAREGGTAALLSHPAPGRPPKLTAAQMGALPDLLWHGAEAYGFSAEVWTCERVAGVLFQEWGVAYSKSQVSRVLKRLGWTPQLPITRAIQRDEAAITRWREQRWPWLWQKARREGRTLIFVDESGFYLLPARRKTYAPQGQTPVLDVWQTRDHLSAMGAVTPEGKVFSLVRPESLNGHHALAFLVHLLGLLEGRLLVIWDGSPIHWRAEVGAFLSGTAGRRIWLEALPAYAQDLNPVEWLWQHLKDVELRNLACLDLDQLNTEWHLALGRVRQNPALVRSFFEAAGLPL